MRPSPGMRLREEGGDFVDISVGRYALSNLGGMNVILGKNGCGKSTLLKTLDSSLEADEAYSKVQYITPERGGALIYDSSVEQNTNSSPEWLNQSRRVNQFQLFKNQTVIQYRVLETQVLREFERAHEAGETPKGFNDTVDLINSLLDNVQIDRGSGPIFTIRNKASGAYLAATEISSGESELISLAIECLVFFANVTVGSSNVLLLDEPDVHLHPDLQARFMRFLQELMSRTPFTVIMATHSTAMLGGSSDGADCSVALMRAGETALHFEPVGSVYRAILPVFGAHPLSNVFNETPILIVEGGDDVRIWQQAIRTSSGSIRLFPVECGGLPYMSEYEGHVKRVADAVYDQPRAFSLRDRDDNPEQIDDLPPLTRLRLSCRAAENMLLCDEVLAVAGTTWAEVQRKIEEWIVAGISHPRRTQIEKFRNDGYQRKDGDLKELRMILVGEMIASTKPWEVLVGQAIGNLRLGNGPNSLRHYLGEKTVSSLLPLAED